MLRVALTSLVVLLAIAAFSWKYIDYIRNPWTRDGQVRAQIIRVAPRVTGPIVDLPIVDNQHVSAGELLFRIDPRTYVAARDEARANLQLARNTIASLIEDVAAKEAAVRQLEQRISEAQSDLTSAEAQEVEISRNLERVTALVEARDLPQARLDQAQASERVVLADIARAEAAVTEAEEALTEAQAALASAQADLGDPSDENARLRAARATLEQAELDLEFTEVRASVSGWVTNLRLQLGTQAVANEPALALVDAASFWIDGYFRETMLKDVQPGDVAYVTLMTYPGQPLRGRVQSIGWGIATPDSVTGEDLLLEIQPTFQWIRLAQRVPVRVELDALPENIELRVGTTASVLVLAEGDEQVPALPAFLQ